MTETILTCRECGAKVRVRGTGCDGVSVEHLDREGLHRLVPTIDVQPPSSEITLTVTADGLLVINP